MSYRGSQNPIFFLLDTAHHLKTGQAQLKNITFFWVGELREEDREREGEREDYGVSKDGRDDLD